MYLKELTKDCIEMGSALRSKIRSAANLPEDVDPIYTDTLQGLSFLPAKNLESALSQDFTEINDPDLGQDNTELTIPDILFYLSQGGYFSFEPYTFGKPYSNPSLVLNYDAYLHLFRGYYFQISYTENGTGSRDINCYYLGPMITEMKDSDIAGTLFEYAVWYMSVCELGMRYSNFARMYKNNPLVIDEFLQHCFEYWYVENNNTRKNLFELITIKNSDKIELSNKNGMIYAICVKEHTVAYVTKSNTLIEVMVPGKYARFDVPEICDEDVNTDDCINQLTLGLLAIMGISCNWQLFYAKKNIYIAARKWIAPDFAYRVVNKLSDFDL